MIRYWEQRDSIYLRKLILSLLKNQHKFGSRILPTERNVNWYLQIGFRQIEANQDPNLVYEEEGEILGFVQLGAIADELDSIGKTAEFFGMYVKPEARGRFINIELIREMALLAIKKGYTNIRSAVMCSNAKVLNNFFINPSIWPTSVNLEWNLENDPQLQDGEFIKFLERRAS